MLRIHECHSTIGKPLQILAGIICLLLANGIFAQNAINGLFLIGISADSTNLAVTANIPNGLQEVIIESRPKLDAEWQQIGLLDAPTAGGEVLFTIPTPTNSMGFVRLRATQSEPAFELISGELTFVAVPPLSENLSDRGEATFHFRGRIDGSEKIVLTRDGALWHHINWHWPGEAVAVNGTRWNPEEKNYLSTPGGQKFLPDQFSLIQARFEILGARDTVAFERTAGAIIIYLNDTLLGSDEYEFKLFFQPVRRTEAPAPALGRNRLNIAANIDGSDLLRITHTEARWESRTWIAPTSVAINGVHWDPANPLKNEGETRFLPAAVDLSNARIVSRKARDLVTIWSDKETLWVWFSDNPNGADRYELEVSLGE